MSTAISTLITIYNAEWLKLLENNCMCLISVIINSFHFKRAVASCGSYCRTQGLISSILINIPYLKTELNS